MANLAVIERRSGMTVDGNLRPGDQPDPFEPDPNVDDSLDMSQLWATLRSKLPFIFAFAAVLYALVIIATMFSRMSFRSSGRLYLGELEVKNRAPASPSEVDFAGGGQGDVGSELEILKSQSFVTQAILDSGLNVTVTPRGWNPPRYWQWLLSRRDPRVIERPLAEISAAGASIAATREQRFGARFITPVVYELWSKEGLLGRGKLGKPLSVKGVDITLLPGLERGPVAGSEYEVEIQPLTEFTETVLEGLAVVAPKAVAAGEAAKVVTLNYAHSSPHAASNFLRRLMENYLSERQAWKSEDATAAENFVRSQLQSLRQSLDVTGSKLADYRSNTQGVLMDTESKAMIEQMGKYEEQRVLARLQVAGLLDMKRALKDPNPPAEAFMFGEAQDTVLAELSESLTNARRNLRDAEQQFGAAAPQSRQQKGKVDAQLDVIRNYVSNRLARAQGNLASMNNIIGQFESKLKSVPGAELGLAQLERESEVYNRVYSYMLERQQQAAITKASTISKNRILDLPQANYREDAPRLGLRIASGFLWLLLGAIIVIARRLFAGTFQSENEVQKVAGRLPIFARLPAFPQHDGGNQIVVAAPFYDVLADDPSAPFVEALRTLRTNIYHWSRFEHGRVLLMTSSQPNDGKTTCALALAAILASDGRRVLVVDADLRKPSHHRLLGTQARHGLRGILSGQCDWPEAVQRVSVTRGSFDSIAAGTVTASEVLSSERAARFINSVRSSYDFVLLDGPSYPLVADSLILATVSDCVLSVVRLRNTVRKSAAEHMRRLYQSAPKYGLIVNDTENVGAVYPSRARKSLVSRGLHSAKALFRSSGGQAQKARKKKTVAIWSVVCILAIEFAVLKFVTPDHFDFRMARQAAGKAVPIAAPTKMPAPGPLSPSSPRGACSPSTPGNCKSSASEGDRGPGALPLPGESAPTPGTAAPKASASTIPGDPAALVRKPAAPALPRP
ncbi:MAG: capsular exopolysaccharide family [Myxococcaceae bacterium]|nr:capsular exopolysaccharide family [Myxococcaceae bacterium]